MRLIKRWGMAADEQVIAGAVKRNEISELKKSGKSLNVEVPVSHFRSGHVGSFRSDIPNEILVDFEHRFGHLLSRWGYQPVATIPSAKASL